MEHYQESVNNFKDVVEETVITLIVITTGYIVGNFLL